MEKNVITRKTFLVNSSKYAIGAAVGIAGLNLLAEKELHAGNRDSKSANWPYPYTNLDPEVARIKAHTLYWGGMDCGTGAFGGIVQMLDTALGAPWTGFPIEIMLFARGGGVSWGSLCGALNGAAALISMVVPKDPSVALINELWGWYTSQSLPTDAANNAVYTVQNYVGSLPQSISGSPLCHPSVSQWCMVASKKVSDVERKERCGRLAGDVAAKTVEILNAYFATTFVGTFADPASNASCMSCHGSTGNNNVMTHMECATCHPDAHHIGIQEIGLGAGIYTLDNPYPNPFSESTNIKFSIPNSEKVRLEIYDLKGKLVNSLIDSDMMNAGSYKATWDGINNMGETVSSGIYFARLTTGNFIKTVKISLSK